MKKNRLTAPPRKTHLLRLRPVGEEKLTLQKLLPTKKKTKEIDNNSQLYKPQISDMPSQLTKTELISLLQYPAKSDTLTMFYKESPSKIPRPKAK